MVGCKAGCLCSDISKELCCCECKDYIKCKDVCSIIKEVKRDVLYECENAYKVEK